MMDDRRLGMHTTLTTSIVSPTPTLASLSEEAQKNIQALLASQASAFHEPANGDAMRIERSGDSTVNGVVIGLLSSFGSALLIVVIFLIVYFFRYTSSGRILLDRIGRPGEYDDEQQYAREEAEALEEMDDSQRTEYLRAKGTLYFYAYLKARAWCEVHVLTLSIRSVHTSKSPRLITDRHFLISISSDPRERRISMGV